MTTNKNKKPSSPKATPEKRPIEDRILTIAWRCWEEIASDALSLVRGEDRRDYLKGGEVIELVADRLYAYESSDPEAVKTFLAMDYAAQNRVLSKRFKRTARFS